MLVKSSATVSTVVEKLGEQVFRNKKETLLMHSLKKILASDARKDLRKQLGDQDAIVYSDYSKGSSFDFWKRKQTKFMISEITMISPENVKSAAFGASNQTLQLIPQVMH